MLTIKFAIFSGKIQNSTDMRKILSKWRKKTLQMKKYAEKGNKWKMDKICIEPGVGSRGVKSHGPWGRGVGVKGQGPWARECEAKGPGVGECEVRDPGIRASDRAVRIQSQNETKTFILKGTKRQKLFFPKISLFINNQFFQTLKQILGTWPQFFGFLFQKFEFLSNFPKKDPKKTRWQKVRLKLFFNEEKFIKWNKITKVGEIFN